jgi:hypothetical protein
LLKNLGALSEYAKSGQSSSKINKKFKYFFCIPDTMIWSKNISRYCSFKASRVKVNAGMGLPLPHKMSILSHKVSSHPFPPHFLYSPFSYWLPSFLKKLGNIRRLSSFLGGKLNSGADCEKI